MAYRQFREKHPLFVVQWEGIEGVTDGQTNVLMYQDFLEKVRMRIEPGKHTITILPTELEIASIVHSGLAPHAVGTIAGRKVTVHSFPDFSHLMHVPDVARQAALASTTPVPARF